MTTLGQTALALCILALASGGCTKKKQTSSGLKSPGDPMVTAGMGETMARPMTRPMTRPMARPVTKRCRPDANSRYPKPPPPSKPETLCKTDADCVVTTLIPGNCCSHGCNQRWIFTRKYLDRVRKRQRECCDGAKYDCPRWSCPRAKFKITAKCEGSRCARVRTKIK